MAADPPKAQEKTGFFHRCHVTGRAAARLAGLGALMAVILPAQMLVAGPLLKNYTTLPRLMNRGMKKLLGLRIVFKGVPPVKDPQMMYIANHLSWLDSVIMGNFVSGALISKFGKTPIPGVKKFGEALGVIFVQSDNKHKDSSGKSLTDVHREVAGALNRGRNILVFPEGKSSDGSGVQAFKAGVLTIMFNNVSAVPLAKEIRVQPFTLRVTRVDGRDMTGAGALKEVFSWYSGFTPQNLWTVLRQKNIDIEVTGLPVMNPKLYPDRQEFVAAAEKTIRNALARPAPPPARVI